jgi:hypothetical protein
MEIITISSWKEHTYRQFLEMSDEGGLRQEIIIERLSHGARRSILCTTRLHIKLICRPCKNAVLAPKSGAIMGRAAQLQYPHPQHCECLRAGRTVVVICFCFFNCRVSSWMKSRRYSPGKPLSMSCLAPMVFHFFTPPVNDSSARANCVDLLNSDRDTKRKRNRDAFANTLAS